MCVPCQPCVHGVAVVYTCARIDGQPPPPPPQSSCCFRSCPFASRVACVTGTVVARLGQVSPSELPVWSTTAGVFQLSVKVQELDTRISHVKCCLAVFGVRRMESRLRFAVGQQIQLSIYTPSSDLILTSCAKPMVVQTVNGTGRNSCFSTKRTTQHPLLFFFFRPFFRHRPPVGQGITSLILRANLILKNSQFFWMRYMEVL